MNPSTPTPIRHRAGGVAFRQAGDEFEVMLISLSRPARWQLPLVDRRRGETAAAAALRALSEATGLRAFAGPHLDRIEQPAPAVVRPGYGPAAALHTDYLLMRALTVAPVQPGWEIESAAWIPLDEAIDLAAAAEERAVLTRARSLLRAPGPSTRLLPPLLAHLLGDLPPATLGALAETDLWVEEERYTIIAVPSDERDELIQTLGEAPALVTIDDGDEFTVVLDEAEFARAEPLLAATYQIEPGFRFVRLEATLPWETVGYGAAVFAALAAAGVSAGFYSGYSIDYLLIGDNNLPLATAAIEALVAEAGQLVFDRLED